MVFFPRIGRAWLGKFFGASPSDPFVFFHPKSFWLTIRTSDYCVNHQQIKRWFCKCMVIWPEMERCLWHQNSWSLLHRNSKNAEGQVCPPDQPRNHATTVTESRQHYETRWLRRWTNLGVFLFGNNITLQGHCSQHDRSLKSQQYWHSIKRK